MNIFRHKHELENGRTSDIGREILGFDAVGNVVNYSTITTPTWSEIIENSSKVICFVDLAGHKRYFKTTVCGMTGHFPDYAMLLVGAKSGTIGMTNDHYNLTSALQIPTIIVVTKIDICSQKSLEKTMNSLKIMLQKANKNYLIIENEQQVIHVSQLFYNDNEHGQLTPIFKISNVTGENLSLLRLFFSLVNPLKDWTMEREKEPLLYIDDTFSVTDVGTVVSGTLIQGKISHDDCLLLGPIAATSQQENSSSNNCSFIPLTVKSVHSNRLPVEVAFAGQSISLAFHEPIQREDCRKGQALMSTQMSPNSAVWEFEANICFTSDTSIVPKKYECVVHCACSKQTAIAIEILDDENSQDSHDLGAAGSTARVKFQYKYHSEFVRPGDRFIFWDDTSGGVGTILHTSSSPIDFLKRYRKDKKEKTPERLS